MVKLTETMILQRTKKGDIQAVRKLNCWGCDITDVSIVRKMPFVEILSLSVNHITSLEDFSYCTHLEELYLRKNDVNDLEELYHLQHLPKLRVLWLTENPCAELPDYRVSVLRVLPNLQMLDNQPVTAKEVRRASYKLLDSAISASRSESVFQSASEYDMMKSKQSTNVLHAVLSLIHELDRDALEVVDDAVRNLLGVS